MSYCLCPTVFPRCCAVKFMALDPAGGHCTPWGRRTCNHIRTLDQWTSLNTRPGILLPSVLGSPLCGKLAAIPQHLPNRRQYESCVFTAQRGAPKPESRASNSNVACCLLNQRNMRDNAPACTAVALSVFWRAETPYNTPFHLPHVVAWL